jgi:hypothetical protein
VGSSNGHLPEPGRPTVETQPGEGSGFWRPLARANSPLSSGMPLALSHSTGWDAPFQKDRDMNQSILTKESLRRSTLNGVVLFAEGPVACRHPPATPAQTMVR